MRASKRNDVCWVNLQSEKLLISHFQGAVHELLILRVLAVRYAKLCHADRACLYHGCQRVCLVVGSAHDVGGGHETLGVCSRVTPLVTANDHASLP